MSNDWIELPNGARFRVDMDRYRKQQFVGALGKFMARFTKRKVRMIRPRQRREWKWGGR